MLRAELRAEDKVSMRGISREISIPRESKEILQKEIERAD